MNATFFPTTYLCRSDEMHRAIPSIGNAPAIAQNAQRQVFVHFPSNTADRLRQRAKIKAHKDRGTRRTSVRRSDEMRRAIPSSEYSQMIAQNTSGQNFKFLLSNIADRLRQRAKIKAHKDRGTRRTSVRRSDEMRRATPSSEYSQMIAQNTSGQNFKFLLSNIADRLRQRAKIKAHKRRGTRRTSVRRSDEMRRATPSLALWRNRSGFSYLGVLILVAVMSVTLLGAGRYWSTIAKREREAELLYKGDQIRNAIAAYYNNPPGGQSKTYPRQFSDLLKDPRYPNLKRYLRKWYSDPMTRDGDWVYVLDASKRIKGVQAPARVSL